MNTNAIITNVESGQNPYTIDSREVAEMVEKQHNTLLKDIRRYTKQLGEGKIAPSDFWTESSYQNSQNKTQPCYLITKKGCEFIAHKMTGTKGTVFTARYIERFHEMEERLKADQAEITGSQVPPVFMDFMRRQDAINQRQVEMNEIFLRQQEQILRLLEEGQKIQKPVLEPALEPEEMEPASFMDPFIQSDTRYRLKVLKRDVTRAADLLNLTVMETYHQLYDAVEEVLHLDLNSFMHVYRWETGEKSTSPLRVIAAHERLFNVAAGILEKTIRKLTGGRS